jgi:hypothetical protein
MQPGIGVQLMHGIRQWRTAFAASTIMPGAAESAR